MSTAYSRVTVVGVERTVDIALPSGLPLSDVVPQVLRFCAPIVQEQTTTAWTLARLGGTPLPLGQTLSDAGVLDGDVLELRGQHSDVRPATVEDVRDLVEDSTDAAGGVWHPSTTVTFALVAGAVVLAVLLAVAVLTPYSVAGDDAVGIGSGVAAVAALLGGVAWSVTTGHRWVTLVCGGVALAWAYDTGDAVARTIGSGESVGAAALVSGSCVAVLVAVGTRLLTPGATPLASFAVVAAVAGVAVGVVELLDVESAQVVRVAPVLLLLAVGVVPRVSLSVGGLASADYRVRHVATMSSEALQARYRESNDLLLGALWAIALVVVVASLQLTTSDLVWDRYLAVSLGVVALLRSRVFSRTQHLAPLRTAGVLVLALQPLRVVVDEPDLRQWLVLAAVAAVLLAVAVSSTPMSDVTRARVKRVLNVVELVVVIEMVVMLAGSLGVFEQLGSLV